METTYRYGAPFRRAESVVLVDHDSQVLSTLELLLGRSTYRVRTAGSGEEALRLLRQAPADLVISEVLMPGMSGAELIRRVRQEYPLTAVMQMTGFTDELLDPEVPLLRKPFDASVLLDRVRRVLSDARTSTTRFKSLRFSFLETEMALAMTYAGLADTDFQNGALESAERCRIHARRIYVFVRRFVSDPRHQESMTARQQAELQARLGSLREALEALRPDKAAACGASE